MYQVWMQCLKPEEDVSKLSIKELSIKEIKARTLQVHHSDYNPANSDLNNIRPFFFISP